jgi:ABC-2 type transport system permease protein
MRLLRLQLARRLQARLAYRADFLLNAVADVALAAAGLVLLGALFRHVPSLGAWSAGQVLFCWGFAEAVVGLFLVMFQGLWVLNQQYILGGDLDRVLLRPQDPLLQVLLDNVSLPDLPILLLGAAVMVASVGMLPPVPLWRWALLPLFVASGAAVLGGVLTAVCSMGFHLRHRGTAVGLVFQISTFNRYPIDLFARPLRLALTFALPLAFAGFYPASFFIGADGWFGYALATPVVAAIVLLAGYGAFRFGLTRYTSSGT